RVSAKIRGNRRLDGTGGPSGKNHACGAGGKKNEGVTGAYDPPHPPRLRAPEPSRQQPGHPPVLAYSTPSRCPTSSPRRAYAPSVTRSPLDRDIFSGSSVRSTRPLRPGALLSPG